MELERTNDGLSAAGHDVRSADRQEDRVAALIAGVGVGATLMYFTDPGRGRRRRARMRDLVAHGLAVGTHAMGATGRDVGHRAVGAAARARRVFGRRAADDAVLVERVRAQLGRLVSHPHAVHVDASDGRVTLRGPVLEAEVAQLLRGVSRVRGVRHVGNALEEHKERGAVPALQGGSTPHPPEPDYRQRQWAPATRLAAAALGAGLTGRGAARGGLPGALLMLGGAALVTRAVTNLDAARLTGVGAGRRAVDLQKTITIDAPVEEVFAFWSNYENFPRFMSRVLEVRRGARERQSHWKVVGPAGLPVHFDAEVSAFIPNQVFGWRTLDGAPVAHAGLVRFERIGDRRTRVQIRMSYNPPGGWLGHEVAAAFGVDPKHSLDEDLVRMKTLLETGRRAKDAAQPALQPH